MSHIQCRACGCIDVSVEAITCTIPPFQDRTSEFFICGGCGYAGSPGNVSDYRTTPFHTGSRPESSTRVGDGISPRREYRMAEMGVDILRRYRDYFRPDVLVFGSGLSKDYILIKQQLPVSRVAISDLLNFQSAEDFVPVEAPVPEFDLMIACEVIEHFIDLQEDFSNLLGKIRDGGLVIASTNMRDSLPLDRVTYPFLRGHTSYYTGCSLQEIGRRFGMKVDFRTPAIAMSMKTGGPRKRYIFFYRDPAIGECISQYFADYHLAPSE